VSEAESDITLLSMGQHLTSLVAGKLHPQLDYDLLMVGSQTNLLAYDIEKNKELFYKDVCIKIISLIRKTFLSILIFIAATRRSQCNDHGRAWGDGGAPVICGR
jgi:hypothetical protein